MVASADRVAKMAYRQRDHVVVALTALEVQPDGGRRGVLERGWLVTEPEMRATAEALVAAFRAESEVLDMASIDMTPVSKVKRTVKDLSQTTGGTFDPKDPKRGRLAWS